MSGSSTTFVGFGFGAIQAGLFGYEAFRSGNFQRLVVAEVVPEVVEALHGAKGNYRVNIAGRSGVEVQEVRGVEILNPTVPEDARRLEEALAEATEIATALPSVAFYQKGAPTVAGFVARALQRKAADERLPRCIVYTAENDNRAAEILFELCEREWPVGANDSRLGPPPSSTPGAHAAICCGGQILNTVIGKMSGVVTDPEQIAAQKLAPLADGLARAILVEEFNRILVTRIDLPDFQRGIRVFVEKPDLLPFEEAKLYGHNAVHALLGYLAQRQGCRFMSEAADDPALMKLAREAFIEESGAALIARYQGLDPLFTSAGYRDYADDLLARMTNPYLRDSTERVTRDTRRKLGWNDRLVGTMRLALEAGIKPWRFALGAAAALETLAPAGDAPALFDELWPVQDGPPGRKFQLIQLLNEAKQQLRKKEYLTYGTI
jgi:mannitol-1-phosphate 5-dehydrogenase